MIKHGVHAGTYEKGILLLNICKYLHVVKCCEFVNRAHFLLSNVYFSPRDNAECSCDQNGWLHKRRELTQPHWQIFMKGFPKPACSSTSLRYDSDICSSRSSGTKSKTLPVGFHKEPDSWIICGGFSVAMSCMTPSFLLEGLNQPASVFLSTPARQCCKLQGSKDGRKEPEFESNWKKETKKKKDLGVLWIFTFRNKPKNSPDKTLASEKLTKLIYYP